MNLLIFLSSAYTEFKNVPFPGWHRLCADQFTFGGKMWATRSSSLKLYCKYSNVCEFFIFLNQLILNCDSYQDRFYSYWLNLSSGYRFDKIWARFTFFGKNTNWTGNLNAFFNNSIKWTENNREWKASCFPVIYRDNLLLCCPRISADVIKFSNQPGRKFCETVLEVVEGFLSFMIVK